mgnify:CR=1 FL=1
MRVRSNRLQDNIGDDSHARDNTNEVSMNIFKSSHHKTGRTYKGHVGHPSSNSQGERDTKIKEYVVFFIDVIRS